MDYHDFFFIFCANMEMCLTCMIVDLMIIFLHVSHILFLFLDLDEICFFFRYR